MTTRASVAASVAKSKAAHPEEFCTHAKCLWRTGGGKCPRHRDGALRVKFFFRDGRHALVGPVQGSGGFIQTILRLQGAARLAKEGRPHGLYEPEPGAVACFPDYCAESRGEAVLVRLSEVGYFDALS
jgi:hypothetical protein